MSLVRIARAPAVVLPSTATVLEAVERMKQANAGAVAVLDQKGLAGMFSERDVAIRVVLEKRDPERTTLAEVMTTGVTTVGKSTAADEAVRLMWERKVRHLPIVNDDGSVEGIVEIRDLFHERFEDLTQQLDSMERYLAADGAGG